MNHCREIEEFFQYGNVNFESKNYRLIAPPIAETFRYLTKAKPDSKQSILHNFSKDSWERLALEEKKRHSFIDCKGCLGDKDFKNGLSLFPIKGQVFIAKAKKHGLIRKPLQDISNTVLERRKEENIKKKLVRQIEIEKEKTVVAR